MSPSSLPSAPLRRPARPSGLLLQALASLGLLGLTAPGLRAQEPQSAAPTAAPAALVAVPLPPVSVSATRERRSVDETAATVTVIEDEAIEQGFVKDIRDLVRNEPGVSVRRAPARFGQAQGTTGREGNAGFNIRGLDGNRVLIQVDGIRVPAAFSFGAANFGRGDFVDLGGLRSIEILRGPASTLYGSDGLAGVVSFYTFDPADLLGPGAGASHASVAAAWAQEDRSVGLNLRGARRLAGDARAGTELLAIVGHRRGHELDTEGSVGGQGAARSQPNPQDHEDTSLLLKWVHRPDAQSQWRVTLDAARNDTRTEVLSARSASVNDLRARDRIDRDRASVDVRFDGLRWALADRAQLAVYAQQAETRQFAAEDRATLPDRLRDNRYEERLVGVNLQLDKQAGWGGFKHRIVYGLDLSQARIDNLRDGTVPPSGEIFPTKAFPASDYTSLGVFLQDEIRLAERWFLTPALRYDHFELDAREDVAGNTSVDLSDGRLTPKLALRWVASEQVSAYINLAQGFRAPTPGQVNNGFTNLTSPFFAYQSIGNPDLKPERSRTVELGLNGTLETLRWSAAVFEGRFSDFIEQTTVGGMGTVADPTRFQFVNLGEVRIRGLEARLAWHPAAAWTLEAAYAQARGESAGDAGRPLNSIDPPRLNLQARWTPQPGLLLNAALNHVREKSRSRIDSSGLAGGAQQFATPSFTTLDLGANWRINRHVDVGLGVFNLFDRKHFHWADVQGLAQGAAGLDAYTQPGRSLALRARITH